ncbi:Cro/CI family transcriptional regulator [Acinetobacter baumannii]|uniref:Cro/CI family transcriptional regulator n=1 Tax=Acinetobacter baumannii TaxID=470 RepID=UPI00229C2662|nr:Cro/CI family transcriptional regulator [Acinetobacter baumannii]MDC4710862.1 Cro/CI family transcriptional regulator [Acinetobacter baumannii]MDC5156169.1 Cro/CI family transcriptional regulator [Acinetobacter baumannii]MDC5205335.1 Cro/CI family transcriptional regulator [Acinetobacter baumannii]MDK2101423.1 Cro/CI family transcriptional regulator [Acinetobacter baumannii]MDK2148733.1 Cro/CI family transcriptional regulator [Acinetobacter baumannii]
MNDAQLIYVLGGVTAVARLLGIAPSSVSGWKAIPLDRKIRLAVIAEDLGLTTRQELFPDNYQDIWIELRPQSGKYINLETLTV